MRKNSKKRQIFTFLLGGIFLWSAISSIAMSAQITTNGEEASSKEESTQQETATEQQSANQQQENEQQTTTSEQKESEQIVNEEAASEEQGKNAGTETINEEENNKKTADEEATSGTTDVQQIDDFTTFEEETAKLVAQYDNDKNDMDTIASQQEDNPYATRRLIVKRFGQELDFSSLGADVILNGPDDVSILQFSTEEATKEAKEKIEQMDGVKYCEVDGYDKIVPVTTGTSQKKTNKAKTKTGNAKARQVSGEEEQSQDKIASQESYLSWGTSYIHADSYATHCKDNQNEIIVAVVDTGIDEDHPYLESRLSLDGAYNYVQGSENVNDDNGHGTNVSGVVADTTLGLNIKILPIKCMDKMGSGSILNIANAIKHAADAGASVINYSAVGTHSEYKEEAIEYAIQKGVSVVVASGNFSLDIDENERCPAHIENCIVVGGIDENGEFFDSENYGTKLDVVAPGVEVQTTHLNGTYTDVTGTSIAAPHVSGAVAMLKLENPSYTPSVLEQLIKENATDLGDAGRDDYYGYGVIDLFHFVQHKEVIDEAVAPTCTSTGLTEGSHCSVCNEVIKEQEVVAKTNHTYVEQITKATTSQNGKKQQICSMCGHVKSIEEIAYPKTVTLSTASYTYNGKVRKPTVTIQDANGDEISSAHYSVTYPSGRKNVGTYTITVKFKGNLYKGTLKKTFKITRATQKIKASNIKKTLGSSAFSLSNVTLEKGDGALSYASSDKSVATVSKNGKVTIKKIGKTTLTITAAQTANYKKTTKKITLTVVPKSVKITKAVSKYKTNLSVFWSAGSSITAYQIQYSQKASFSNATTKTVSNRTYQTFSGLSKGKKYYVRIRAYKKVGTATYYSAWSSAKTVTIKK